MGSWTKERRCQHASTMQPTLVLAHRACRHAADQFAGHYLPMLLSMQQHGVGVRAMARAMNANGFSSRQGGPWTEQTVRQVLKRRQSLLTSELFDEQPEHIVGWTRHG